MESHADVLTWFLRYIPYMKKKKKKKKKHLNGSL